MMSEYFLGMWGGGIPKPFKFTEIQKHRFGLKSKDSEADRYLKYRSNNKLTTIFKLNHHDK